HAPNRARDGHGCPWAHRGLDPGRRLGRGRRAVGDGDDGDPQPRRDQRRARRYLLLRPFASGRPDRGGIDLSIQQRHAGRTVAAIGYLEPAVCDGTSEPFEVTLTSTDGGRLRKGAATW